MAFRTKISQYGLLVAMFLLFAILGYHSYRNILRLREDCRMHAEMELKYANYVFNQEMSLFEQTMADVTEPVLSFVSTGNQEHLQALTLDILQRHQYSDGCYVVFSAEQAAGSGMPALLGAKREDGVISPCRKDILSDQEYQQEWYSLPVGERRNVWTFPYYSPTYADSIVSFSHPVMRPDGTVAALLLEDIPTDRLASIIDMSPVFAGSEFLLITSSGRVVLSSNNLQDIPDERKYFIYKGTVGSQGSQLVIALPSGRVYRRALGDGLLTILVLLAFVIIAYLSARRSFRSLREESQRQVMEREMSIAHDIQMSMVPDKFPPFPERSDLDIYAMMSPASNIGGDFYDYFIRDEKLFFCIGDVSGKGVPASLLMSMCRTMFRTLGARESSPELILSSINSGLKELGGRNMFVTLFLGVLDLPTGILRCANAGHCPPYVLDSKGLTALEVKPNLPAGVRERYDFVRQDFTIQSGQTLFLYTDGITEAQNPAGQLYGIPRLEGVLGAAGNLSPREVIGRVNDGVVAYASGAAQSDDVTMLAIRYTPTGEQVLLSRSITLENRREEVARLHDFVAAFSADAGLSARQQGVIDLCLEEAVVNVILYAYPYGARGLMNLEARQTPGRLVFVLSDEGKPFDPTSVAQADLGQRGKDRRKGGLGIYLIRQQMTSINYNYRDGHNILTLTLLNSEE